MVGKPFPPAGCCGEVLLIVLVAVRVHLVETLARAVHAFFVVGAVTAGAERLLGHGNVRGELGLLDEPELGVHHLVVALEFVDNADRE